jgi:hypothetical protein
MEQQSEIAYLFLVEVKIVDDLQEIASDNPFLPKRELNEQ